MEFIEEIREFLIESNENLSALDREIVLLEQDPQDKDLISSAFRTFHTIKGTCGFFGFEQLGALTHVTENILSQARDGERVLTPELISLILSAIDEIKSLLGKIETTGAEGDDHSSALRERLEEAYRSTDLPVPAVSAASLESRARPAPPLAEIAKPLGTEEPATEADAGITAEANRENHLAESSIRVDVGLLNRLMNLVGELVLARNQLLQETSAQHTLQQTSQRLNLITSELQESVMKTRMQPIGVIWNKLPRVVRDLASKCGKRVQIEMEGAGTELDKTIIEAIKDPITHIVRNSCDHGIESPEQRQNHGKAREGRVTLRAYHEGGVVNIEISDDGAGIDPERVKAKAIEKGLIRAEDAAQMSSREAVQLIFMPGFSTAAQITNISGRGVGMDVVKTNIEKIGGNVDILNRLGSGTTIRIKIPLTLAIIPGLVVTLQRAASPEEETRRCRGEERFIIPQANLLELVRLEGAELHKRITSVHGTPVFHHRSKLLPLLHLNRMLGADCADRSQQHEANIVVLQAEHRQLGLVVDRICDTQEIVVKPLGRQLKGLNCYVGATIMGDGRPALILDVVGLARLGGLTAQARAASPLPPEIEDKDRPQALLLLRAGQSERLAIPLSMVDRLEEVSSSQIERAGRRLVLHYREDILPLVSLGTDPSREEFPQTSVQIVVFSNGQRRVGLIVDQIIDIVNEVVRARRPCDSSGLLGAAVIGGKVTDLLDLQAIVESAGEDWLGTATSVSQKTRCWLLLDSSSIGRQIIADLLTTAGCEVIQTAAVCDALTVITKRGVDAIVLADGITASDRVALLQSLAENGGAPLPVVELSDAPTSTNQSTESRKLIRLSRRDRASMLDILRRVIDSSTAVTEHLA